MNIEKALLKPEAYPEKVKKVKVLQTHISWVFLTGKHAYKVKKPVNFGFVNFSTLNKRKFYSKQELKLNRRLAPELYLKVLPIVKIDNEIKIGGKGKIVDWAVVMKELPQEMIMSVLLKNNKITKKTIKKIAKIIADFHKKNYPKVKKKYKSIKIIKFNWNENFELVEKFIQKTISKSDFEFIKNKINEFFRKNKSLFQKRAKENKIKWCHGDLHSGNIFISNKIYIFDCIEFNERFSSQDVADEVAFLAMDLDFYKRKDLSNYFIEKYLKYTEDKELLKLLDFYKCYLAFVRGKVNSLKTKDKNIKKSERKKAIKEAKKYFKLALRYAGNLP
jgi:hypothetical protein